MQTAMVTGCARVILPYYTYSLFHMGIAQNCPQCTSCRRPSNPGRSVAVAVAALGGMLREAPTRALFAKSGGVALLAPLLRAGAAGGPGAPGSQLLYEAGLALWQLSFYQPAAAAMGSAGVLPGLVELARTAPKEKARPTLTLNLIFCMPGGAGAHRAQGEGAEHCHAWLDKRGPGLLRPA